MSWLSRGVKKLARSKIVRGVASTAVSALVPAIAQRGLQMVKNIGGRVIANRAAARQEKSVAAIAEKLKGAVQPAVVEMTQRTEKPGEMWVGALSRTGKTSGRKKRSAKSAGGGGSSRRSKKRSAPKAKKAKKPNTRKQSFKAGNDRAAQMKAAAAAWKTLSPDEKKSQGPWATFWKSYKG